MSYFEDLRHGTNALRCTFEILANQQGVTAQELVVIRQEIVKREGKYETDWKRDWLAKLAFDYYFCVEMQTVLEDEGDLSYKRRQRLYWFVTKNEPVQQIWDQLPELSPNMFLSKDERLLSNAKSFRRYK